MDISWLVKLITKTFLVFVIVGDPLKNILLGDPTILPKIGPNDKMDPSSHLPIYLD